MTSVFPDFVGFGYVGLRMFYVGYGYYVIYLTYLIYAHVNMLNYQ